MAFRRRDTDDSEVWQCQAGGPCRGFTLVELLVVIAVIGILVVLLVTAVTAARETARRSTCASKFRQVGLALQSYHANRGHFPSGMNAMSPDCGDSKSYWGFGWSTYVLPHLEKRELYNEFDFKKEILVSPNKEAGATPLGIYLCPTDVQTDELVAMSHSMGIFFGRTNMSGVADSEDWTCTDQPGRSWPRGRANGVLFNSSRVRLDDIKDGPTHTLLIGEITGNLKGDRSAKNWVSWNLADTANGINGPFSGPGDGNWGMDGAGFSSYHPDGCHFVFCDGRVAFLLQTIEPDVLKHLTERADGKHVEDF